MLAALLVCMFACLLFSLLGWLYLAVPGKLLAGQPDGYAAEANAPMFAASLICLFARLVACLFVACLAGCV